MKLFSKNLKTKAIAVMMVLFLSVTALQGTDVSAAVTRTEDDSYFYLMVDPGETSNGFVLEPTCIRIPANTDTSKSIGEIICNNLLMRMILVSCTNSYGYISAIRCPQAADYQISASTYSMYSSLPEVAFHSGIVKPVNRYTKLLGEFNFTGFSGWMFTINNGMMTQNGDVSYYYTMGTTLQELIDMGLLSDEETPVIELFFTMNMGADVGLCDAYLPTEVSSYSGTYAYNWAGNYEYTPAYEKSDRTELIMALADNREDSDYSSSLAVLKDIDASEISIAVAAYNVTH